MLSSKMAEWVGTELEKQNSMGQDLLIRVEEVNVITEKLEQVASMILPGENDRVILIM